MSRYRNITLKIMVTSEEKEVILNRMKKIGMTNFGEFARKILINGTVLKLNTDGLNQLSYEVNKVGNNINQIAKHANQTGYVSKKELDEINQKLDYIISFVNNIYSKINKVN